MNIENERGELHVVYPVEGPTLTIQMGEVERALTKSRRKIGINS